jgi:hypothetical protein
VASDVTEILKSDPTTRRRALALIIAGALFGAVLIAGLAHFREPLREWLLSDPHRFSSRMRFALMIVTAAISAPPLAMAGWLWAIARRVLRAGRFPPPGQRVIRDTPVLTGADAVIRGRILQVLAVCLAAVCAVMWLMYWQLVSLLPDTAA